MEKPLTGKSEDQLKAIQIEELEIVMLISQATQLQATIQESASMPCLFPWRKKLEVANNVSLLPASTLTNLNKANNRIYTHNFHVLLRGVPGSLTYCSNSNALEQQCYNNGVWVTEFRQRSAATKIDALRF